MPRGVVVASLVAAACGATPRAPAQPAQPALPPLAVAANATMIVVPAGPYHAGSTRQERDAAYAAYLATSGHDAARAGAWFEREDDAHDATLPAFRIDRAPVSNAAYAELVATGAVPPPAIDAAAWAAQHLQQDYATEVARFVWRGATPPAGREAHPVVLVTWDEARRYCAWRGARLPTAAEYEKAARGSDGRAYPWGDAFDPARLASAVGGPRDTVPAGSVAAGASPYGVLDLAGNVFAWTATPWRAESAGGGSGSGKVTVKGSAWDDFGGVGRGASQHGRPPALRHAIIGFRCAADAT